MLRKGMTVQEAAETWVREFNAIPQEMIAKLWRMDPDSWHEVTTPATGRAVYVYDLPENCDGLKHTGEITGYDKKEKAWKVELDGGVEVLVEEDGMEVEYDGASRCGGRCGRSETPVTTIGWRAWTGSGSCQSAASGFTSAMIMATTLESTEQATAFMKNTGFRCTSPGVSSGMIRRWRRSAGQGTNQRVCLPD